MLWREMEKINFMVQIKFYKFLLYKIKRNKQNLDRKIIYLPFMCNGKDPKIVGDEKCYILSKYSPFIYQSWCDVVPPISFGG